MEPETSQQRMAVIVVAATVVAVLLALIIATAVDTEPEAPSADAPPVEVLAYWIERAMEGDVERAGVVVAADATWTRIWPSWRAFVESNGPFSFEGLSIDCVSTGPIVGCDVSWRNDVWLEAHPTINDGFVRLSATVEAGFVTDFKEVAIRQDLVDGYNLQLDWLEINRPVRFAQMCSAPVSRRCTKLVAETVTDWIASR